MYFLELNFEKLILSVYFEHNITLATPLRTSLKGLRLFLTFLTFNASDSNENKLIWQQQQEDKIYHHLVVTTPSTIKEYQQRHSLKVCLLKLAK